MPVQSAALWQWDTTQPIPEVKTFANGKVTKTGLVPDDLKQFAGVPLQYYGNPSVPVDNDVLRMWIRAAEDWVEVHSGCLLTQSWIASPPAVTLDTIRAIDIQPTYSGGYQKLGYDYDIEDAAYDFFFPRSRDEGWSITIMRYRPVRSMDYSPFDQNAIKQISYVYPLLNEFFRVPPSWQVEDHDFGFVRLVPAQNVQMLPLFAMQLAFMGFAESVPGGMWFQYTAGLTPNDYKTRYSFVPQLVLAQATIVALTAIQGTINLGAKRYEMMVDGMKYGTEYDFHGPFNGLIEHQTNLREQLMSTLRNQVTGPILNTL